MGAYMSAPVTEKKSDDGGNSSIKYGVSGMQGWRVSMEDAHLCLPDVDKDCAIFAVFDGHGGSEVAEYCSLHFTDIMKETTSFRNGDLKQSLIDSFLGIDQELTKEEAIAELKELAGESKNGEEEVDEAAMLAEEANLPIVELLKRIKQGVGSEGDMLEGDEEEYNEDDDDEEDSDSEEEEDNDEDDDEDEDEEEEEEEEEEQEVGEDAQEDQKEESKKDKRTAGNHIEKKDKDEETKKETEANGQEPERDEKEENEKENGQEETKDSDEQDICGGEEGEMDADEEENDFEENDDFVLPNSDDEVGKDSGTTAIVALLRGNQLVVANAGDSRAVLCRACKAIDLSDDHKPEDPSEKQRIEAAGGKISADGRVNGGLNLSRAIGDHAYKQNEKLPPEKQVISAMPDIKEIELNEEDEFLILACDGIWNVMTSQDVVDFVSQRLKEQEKAGQICLSMICEEMFEKCLAPDTSGDGSGCDNMTCVIVLFNNRSEQFSRVIAQKRKVSESDEKTEEPLDKKQKTSN